MSDPVFNSVDAEVAGTAPEVDKNLKPTEKTRYAIKDGAQAVAVCRNLRDAWKNGIINTRTMTAQLNGQRPRPKRDLENKAKKWYPNLNTGSLRTTASPVPARFSMPILTAQSLTAAELPEDVPNGADKAAYFRQCVTESVKSWEGFPWHLNLLAREVAFFGYGFEVFFDEYEWRPTFIRQDEGFIPVGTKLLDGAPTLFCCAYDYRVDELLRLVDKEQGSERQFWRSDGVKNAVNSAATVAKDSSDLNSRRFEEMVREVTLGQTFEKAYRVVRTWHLFSVDPDGTVSHHIVLADDKGKANQNEPPLSDADRNSRLLFERRKQFDSMNVVVRPLVFDPDNGTIHGSWGVLQMVFDLCLQTEKTWNDWLASLQMAAKIKAQGNSGVTPNDIKFIVEDYLITLTNAIYAGNTAAVTTDPKPFQAMIEGLSQSAREKIGNYIPPIPLTPSDVKAAQIDAKVREQQERREQILFMWLLQWAGVMKLIVKRILNPESDDDAAKKLREKLKTRLTDEEILQLAEPPPLTTIFDYTDYAMAKRAQFAATKQGNPFYNQKNIERVQAEAAGGRSFANYVLMPGDDTTVQKVAVHDQELETGRMLQGGVIEVLPTDADWFHLQALRPVLEETLVSGNFPIAAPMLNHYTGHYVAGTRKKQIPKDRINVEKAFITKAQKAIETGMLPPEGFADQLSPVEQVEVAMSQESPVSEPMEAVSA